jgi:hypothetical protein
VITTLTATIQRRNYIGCMHALDSLRNIFRCRRTDVLWARENPSQLKNIMPKRESAAFF